MAIAPWLRGEWGNKVYTVLWGGELSFLKLGSVLVGFTGGGVKFFLKLLFLRTTVNFVL